MFKKTVFNDKRRMLLVMTTFCLSITEFILAIIYLINNDDIATIICFTSAIVYSIACFIIAKSKQSASYATVLILAIYILLLAGSFIQNKEGLTPLWLILFPPLTFFFIGIKRGVIVNFGALAILILMFYCVPLVKEGTDALDFILDFTQDYTINFRVRFTILFLLAIISSLLLELIKRALESELESKAITLEKLALYDVLTGARNRATFDETLSTLCLKCKKENKPLCLIIADVDLFKKINDNYGHQIGDEILILIAKAYDKTLSENHPYFRWGGEEFLTILPDVEINEAYEIAEELRKAVSDINFITPKGEIVNVTLSLGVHQIDLDNLIYKEFAIADKCLYMAKSNGRNCTVSSHSCKKIKIDSIN